MRIEQLLSGADGLQAIQADPEPEPGGLSPYARQLVAMSYAFAGPVRLQDWMSDSGEARLFMRSKKAGMPARVEASLAGRAFENYVAFSTNDRHEVEYRAAKAMCDIEPTARWEDVNVMLNYVPLLFAEHHMIKGRREHRGDTISFTSDKLQVEHERHMLVGGLATILYYADYPDKL